MSTKKPVIANVSLDDIIQKEKKAKQQQRKKSKAAAQAPMFPPQQEVDYDQFTDDQIREQLQARGLSTRGLRPKLVNRLKAEVQKAWAAYKKEMKAKQNKPKKVKKKLTDAEKSEIHAKNEANRLAKAKRRAENMKRVEEHQARKRQKREESMAKQETLKKQQKEQKEARQRCEVLLKIDFAGYKEALRKKLDPKGTKISNLTQDFSKKGFIVKFKTEKDAATCAKGSTMKKKKTWKIPMATSVLPSPVESKCVFFQYPLDQTHPNFEKAKAWTLEQDSDENLAELKKLSLWTESSAEYFGKYGTIYDVYRERGFLVVYYSTEAAASKCFAASAGAEFNGVPFNFLRMGTPTKADRLECQKELNAMKEE